MNDWAELDMPWLEIDQFLHVILDKAQILDICDKWGLEYHPSATGDFTHRMKCPLPLHSDGGERTASFFMSEDKNNFYCFGCNSGGNVVNLVKLYYGKPFYETLRWIASLYGITKDNAADVVIDIKPKRPVEHTVAFHIFNTGIVIREFVAKAKDKQDYNKLCKWADARFDQLDKYTNTLEDDDWETAKNYYDKVHSFISKKE